MELFSQNLADQLVDSYTEALGKGMVTNRAILAAYRNVESGMNRLSAKLDRYNQEFSTWLALESLGQQGYTRFLFVSERGANTCDQCLSYHGRVFSLADVPILPMHPNCRCELVAMDVQMEMLYHVNEQAFLEQFRRNSGEQGGVYLLRHGVFPFGMTSDDLIRMPLPDEHTIIDLSRPDSRGESDGHELGNAATEYISGLAAETRDLVADLLNAQAERGEHKWDSLGSLMDWLTLGIVSGTWRGMVSNFDAMVDDPSLYNIVNFITLGALDTISGAVAPEDPWSLEHWMDIIGTVLIGFFAYQTAMGVKEILIGSSDDALRAAGSLAEHTDDIVRSAGLTQAQIDDIINIPRGERPDPSTYLSPEYIDQHLSQFRNGATKIYASVPTGAVGPAEGTFVMPSSVADDLIRQANGDVKVLEQLLGFAPGDLGDAPVRVDVAEPHGLRMPTGNERGVNDYWLPGGYTSGGVPEAIIDQIKPGQYVVVPIQ
jgi:hypothetical protein